MSASAASPAAIVAPSRMRSPSQSRTRRPLRSCSVATTVTARTVTRAEADSGLVTGPLPDAHRLSAHGQAGASDAQGAHRCKEERRHLKRIRTFAAVAAIAAGALTLAGLAGASAKK